ncbi:MAG: ammonium transporter [Bdellovibrionota bacterium]
MGIVTVLWALGMFSLAFGTDVNGLIGGFDYFWMNGVGMEPGAYGAGIPFLAFFVFQMMFAIITPALITGAIAERINFKAWIPFMALWVLFVYCPIAHWVWGTGGWIAKMGGLDFAGGLVVHMSSGFSALVASSLLGRRHDKAPMKSYNIAIVVLGTALLIFGWFGFNAGSALAANGIAAQAFATTFFGCAASFFAWMLVDWVNDRPTLVGASIGAVAGLVAITPAAGYVTLPAAMVIGLSAGVICNYAVRLFKAKFHVVDDTLDVFACHGVGGMLGTVLTGVFASSAVNPAATDGLLYGGTKVFTGNLLAAGVVGLYSIAVTALLLVLVKLVVPFRVSREQEAKGLDSLHGESIISLDEIHVTKSATA